MKKYIVVILFIFLVKSLSAQTINYSYDNLGRLTQVMYPDSSTIIYSYDASGNRTTTKINDHHYHAPQTIKFDSIASVTYGAKDFSPGATASSGLPVTYTSSDSTIAKILNGQIHIVKVGTTKITASQAGNTSFAAAINVSRILTVAPAPLTITANNQSKIVGTANPTLTITYSGFVKGDDSTKLSTLPTVSTTATSSSPVGTYPINVSGAIAVNYSFTYVSGVLTVNPVPAPTISTITPTTAMSGDTITITGTNFTNATSVSFGGTAVTSFKVVSSTTITAVVGSGASGDVSVITPGGTATIAGFSFVFSLPTSNFSISTTSASCRGVADGSINITATQSLNYTATITGNGVNNSYQFMTNQTLPSLGAGTYHVCVTVQGQSNYQQCYDLVITEPKDLSVYSTVNNENNTVSLALSGGAIYNIQLNGNNYSTADSNITLPLQVGNNQLTVTTDRICQGSFQTVINILKKIIPFPDPFDSTLSIDLGPDKINNAYFEVHNVADGKVVYSKQFGNQSGVVELDLSTLKEGAYALHITLDSIERVFKIIKK